MHQNNYNLSLSSQNFVVDFLRFNLQFTDKYEIQEVAEYLSKEYSCNSIFIDQKPSSFSIINASIASLITADVNSRTIINGYSGSKNFCFLSSI